MAMDRAAVYAEELAKLIRIETVSVAGTGNKEKFGRFREALRQTFPHVFGTATVEEYPDAILLCWHGRDASQSPFLFMNHHDVVEATGAWKYPPFSGTVAEGKVWGRGTLDTKGGLWAMLRAADELIADGFAPERDVWFSSASTEETDGRGGAFVAGLLASRNIRFEMILDEGGMLVYDPIGGADGTFAMVGLGEKGCVDLKFVARSAGGHASSPGKNTPLVRLGKFMAAAEKQVIFPAGIHPVTQEMMRRMAPTMKGAMRTAFSRPDVFSPILLKKMPAASPSGNAMLRTTVAFTMAGGSSGTNVLPEEAYVVGNLRTSHHQGREASIEAIRALAAKYDIETVVLDPGTDSAVSDHRLPAFAVLEEAVGDCFPGVRVAPYIMFGASDARYFTDLSDSVYRFLPFTATDAQIASIHGLDENVDVAALPPAVDFYKNLMRR